MAKAAVSDSDERELERRISAGDQSGAEALQAAHCRLGQHDGSVDGGTDGCEGCFRLFLRDQRSRSINAPRTRFA